jgi:SpoVK/Ycf46/Vps4 family AAA+-type ATPase
LRLVHPFRYSFGRHKTNVLLGPSGCGKSLIATTLLASLPCAVFAVKAYDFATCCLMNAWCLIQSFRLLSLFLLPTMQRSDLLSRYLGGTEKAIRQLFARARYERRFDSRCWRSIHEHFWVC